MQMQYRAEVTSKLTSLLSDLSKTDRDAEMENCVSMAESAGYLNSTPRTDSAATFSEDLLSDPGMNELVEKDAANGRNALGADSPSEVVANLLPSDGHLD